jgi:hypothetical protein
MIRIAAAALVVLTSMSSARADDATLYLPAAWVKDVVPAALQPGLAAQARKEARDARVRGNAAIGLTVTGTLMTLIGGAVFATACDDCGGRGSTALYAGPILLGLGAAGTVIGIPLWAGGQAQANRSDRVALTLTAGGPRLAF